MRRFGAPPQPGIRYIDRPGAYAVIPCSAGLLMTFQNEPEPEFQLPGGGIDPGESAIAALHREVYEETGWRITGPRRLGAFRRFTYMPEYDLWAEKLCHVYVARPTRRHSDPVESGHTDIWAPWETAETLLANDGDRMFLRSLRRAIGA